MPSGPAPTSSWPLGRRPGRTSSPARCSRSNCGARCPSLRTTLIIVKGEAMRRLTLFLAAAACSAGVAVAQDAAADDAALRQAQQEAQTALVRYQRLEQEAARATNDAARARAEAEALAARIEAGEADITAAEQRLRIAD